MTRCPPPSAAQFRYDPVSFAPDLHTVSSTPAAQGALLYKYNPAVSHASGHAAMWGWDLRRGLLATAALSALCVSAGTGVGAPTLRYMSFYGNNVAAQAGWMNLAVAAGGEIDEWVRYSTLLIATAVLRHVGSSLSPHC